MSEDPLLAATAEPLKTLDSSKPQQTSYCIPTWLRDEQIKLSIARVNGRLEADPDIKRAEPIAVVCFGPSLNETWEQVRRFKYIITGSGAHKFLIDRGIVPTWHVEVDPRAHKIELLGPPHPDVEYLIASACHPKYFDHLEAGLGKALFDKRVKLWHVFDATREGFRGLPRGEWWITGGSNVGLRQMTIARLLGFTDQHVFGMDGCEGPGGDKHAAAHPNQLKESYRTKVNGRVFLTTPTFLECARQTFSELNQMPDVKATFHGDGLVQEMAKNYKPEPVPPESRNIAFMKPELISKEYKELNARLHQENLEYGVGGGKRADTVLKLCGKLHTTCVLDYGCGKGYLAKSLPFPIWEYDPAIAGKDELPRAADIVVCTDVLEHIEPDKLLFVLDDLRRVTKQIAYLVIHMGPAKKHYADGRNTHLIQRDKEWWTKTLGTFFAIDTVVEAQEASTGALVELHMVVFPRPILPGGLLPDSIGNNNGNGNHQ